GSAHRLNRTTRLAQSKPAGSWKVKNSASFDQTQLNSVLKSIGIRLVFVKLSLFSLLSDIP
ncbi:MAG: hypothetical protein WAV39_04505, partial [Gemmiger qucibialis]